MAQFVSNHKMNSLCHPFYRRNSGELIREDNQVLDKTITYSYELEGNIIDKIDYPYTTGTPEISLLSNPITNTAMNYRGIYRRDFIYSYSQLFNSDDVIKLCDWYIDNAYLNAKGIVFNEVSKQNILKLYEELTNQGYNGDIIIFGEEKEKFQGEFLGYDVCGDSNYYSRLGEGFSESETCNQSILMKIIISYFKPHINNNGLFSELCYALEFANMLNEISKSGSNFFEKDGLNKPVKVCVIT